MGLRNEPPTPQALDRANAQSRINKLRDLGENSAADALDCLLTENFQSENVVEAIIETANRRIDEKNGQ